MSRRSSGVVAARPVGRGCGCGCRWRAGSRVSMGDGVEVAVEADVGVFPERTRRVGGEREQSGLLFGPGVGDGSVGQWRRRWATSSRRRNWALQGRRGRAGRRRRRWIWRSPSLFRCPVRACGARREVSVSSGRGWNWTGAATVEDQVIVDEGAGDAAEGVEGFDEEALEGLVEGEEGGHRGSSRTMTMASDADKELDLGADDARPGGLPPDEAPQR